MSYTWPLRVDSQSLEYHWSALLRVHSICTANDFDQDAMLPNGSSQLGRIEIHPQSKSTTSLCSYRRTALQLKVSGYVTLINCAC
jgi:hypothetical protein